MARNFPCREDRPQSARGAAMLARRSGEKRWFG
jgi:hypothetical protein